MKIIENPLQTLVYTLLFLILILIFFKVAEFLGKLQKKNKETKKEVAKKDDITQKEEKEPTPFSDTNYLYDRFVINPTIEDNIEKNKSKTFLDEEDYQNIRNRKIEIKVKEVEDLEVKNNALHTKIQQMTNENRETKERLLSEYESLSREMKLLLIENIMNSRKW